MTPQTRPDDGHPRGRRSRWIGALIGVALGAFTTWQFWPLAQTLIDSASAPAKTKRIGGPAATAPVAPVPSDPQLAAVGTDSSVSKTPLAFVLVGTLPGRNAREGRAMLGTDARNAQTYLAGSMLENGAKLVEIYRDHVVLERGSQHALLYLVGTNHALDPSAQALLTTGGNAFVATYTPPKSEAVTDYLRFIPEYRDGAVAGIRVYPGTRSAIFQKWGLQPGDVVTSIDGALPVDADEVTILLSTLTEGSSHTARVRRGEESIAVTLEGADIVQLAEARKAPPIGAQPAPL